VLIYEAIKSLSSEFKIQSLCRVLGVSRSAYYAYVNEGSYVLKSEKLAIGVAVKRIFESHKRRYGWRRIQGDLAEEGIQAGRYQIRSRMREQNLVAIQAKSFVPKTTQSPAHLRRSANLLLEEDNLPVAPGEVTVGDITYLPNKEQGYGKWLYLAIWMDLFSRRILGWQIERHMEESLVYTALEQVIESIAPKRGFIVHSDGGSQYGSKRFRAFIKERGFRQSMTRKDNHYDNAFAESLFSRFKAEILDEGIFEGLENARLRSFEFIEGYYNTIRRHSSIGNMSPLEFEKRFEQNLKQ